MTGIRNLLGNRKIGLMAALLTWIGCLGILAHDLLRFDRWRMEWSCHEARRDLENALETYALDHGRAGIGRLMVRSPISIQATLYARGYLGSLRPCPGGDIPLVRKVEPARGSMFVTLCADHPGSTDQMLSRLRGQKIPTCRMFVLAIAGLLIFPAAFWIAACVRSYRWSRRSCTAPLPASWIVTLNLLFAPAGLIAMGCYRQAVWQSIVSLGLLATLGWYPAAYLALNLFWIVATLKLTRHR